MRAAEQVTQARPVQVRMKVFGELERATRPARLASPNGNGKLQRYAGHFLRLLDKNEVAIGAIVICHHDPRREGSSRGRRPGTGAEHLAASLRAELYRDGATGHFTELRERLHGIKGNLELGRLIVVQDYDEVLRRGIGAVGYSLFPYPSFDGGDGDPYRTYLVDVAAEYRRLTRHVRAYVHAQKSNPKGTP